MGTSVGAAIDYLVGVFQNGYNRQNIYGESLVVPSLPSFEPTVNIVDVYDDNESGPWVVVGRDSYDQEANVAASASYEVLGRQRILEQYTIPGFILVEGTGTTYKATRDRALALFSGVTKLVWADPTLGGALVDGRSSLVSEFSLTQTDPRSDRGSDSGAGIAAVVTFGVQASSNYIP